jgi:hypothetical protein
MATRRNRKTYKKSRKTYKKSRKNYKRVKRGGGECSLASQSNINDETELYKLKSKYCGPLTKLAHKDCCNNIENNIQDLNRSRQTREAVEERIIQKNKYQNPENLADNKEEYSWNDYESFPPLKK